MDEVDLLGGYEALDGSASNTVKKAKFNVGNRRSDRDDLSDQLKYAIDAFVALVSLLVLSPLMLTVSAILLVTQGGPVMISHRRVGKGGVTFSCFKFRTMVTNGDEVLERHLNAHPEHRAEWEENRKLVEDPRVTIFGRSLRRNSIDELPQLFNVLRGEMSLVGPRPITQSETKLYGPHLVDYIAVRPGLTGLWQVSGRSEVSYQKRVEIDVRYVAERSLIGDLIIMAKTIPAVLSSRGSY
jgi:exopolysaccharide production protein ExoY